jgi:hypothetical protein
MAVITASVALALPAEAATFTTRCVVAREMRIYHTSTSSKPGRTKLHFGTTIYTDKKSHHRYRAWWWTLSEGWHRGWISAKPEVHRPPSLRPDYLRPTIPTARGLIRIACIGSGGA